MKKSSFVMLLVILLISCAPTHPEAVPTITLVRALTATPVITPTLAALPIQPLNGLPAGTDGYPWWNDTVFYEVFVRSFNDSNGDGIGDFNGLTQKLDYLQNLGITGLWLMPINPSPSYHGYDVTDYLAVNPEYGTLADFKSFLSAAHKHNIRVIIDLVLNHTSNLHPWFLAAQDPQSTYHDYYIWSKTNPNYPGPWGEQVWHKSGSEWYYGIFSENMPDLNFRNAAVTTEMEKVAQFWLQNIGVDGFRLDAAKHLIEDGALQENSDETHLWFKQFRSFYKALNPQALTVGEISGGDPTVLASYTQGDQLDLTFDFGQAQGFMDAASSGQNFTAYGAIKLSNKLILNQRYATFLTNHDQNRVMSQLGGDEGQAKTAASMLLTSPGVPFIYYGEELGMQGQKPDEDIRRPMQWNEDQNSGFTSGTPWRSVDLAYTSFNAATETKNPNSLLLHYQNLISLRNQHAALRIGDVYTLRPKNSGIFATLRISKAETVMVLINLTSTPLKDYGLLLINSPLQAGTYLALPLTGPGNLSSLSVDANGAFRDYEPLKEIPAYGTVILQLRK